MEKALEVILEKGLLGALCVLCLFVLWFREKAYLELYARFTKHLANENATKRQLLTEVTGAVNDLNNACRECAYRKFVSRLGGEEP